LHLAVEPRLEIDDAKGSVLVLRFEDGITAVRRRRERVPAFHPRHAGHGGQQLGFLESRNVPHVVPAGTGSIEPVSVRSRIVTHVHVVVGARRALAWPFRHRNLPRRRAGCVAAYEPPHVVHDDIWSATGYKEERPPVRMLVRVRLVKATGRVRSADASHFSDGGRVRQAGDVEHNGADLMVGTGAGKLASLSIVVPTMDLEVFPAQAPATSAGTVQ